MRTQTDRHVDFKFEGLAEMTAYISNTPPSGLDCMRSTRDRHGDHYGNLTLEQACDVARTGWVEGVAKLKKITDGIVPKMSDDLSPKLNMYASKAGGMLNMSRALTGHPIPFVRFKNEPKHNPVVDLHYLVDANCQIGSDQIIAWGSGLAAAIRTIEQSGKRVRLTVNFGASDGAGRNKVTMSILAKRPQDRLHLNQLTFVCAHPSFLRRLCFAVIERCQDDRICHKLGHGYGVPIGSTSDLGIPESATVIRSDWTISDPKAIAKAIIAQVK